MTPRLPRLVALLALLAAVSAQAAYDFGPWPAGASPREIGGRVAENFAAKPHANFNHPGPPAFITYPETCTWYGALVFARLTGDKALTTRLVARFEPLFGPEAGLIPPPDNVDTTVFAAVPFELFIQAKDPRYLKIGRDLADRQWAAPTAEQLVKLEPGALALAKEAAGQGLTWHTRFWIDDMFMITMVQAQAYRATGDRRYLDRAAHEMVVYLEKLQQPNGLFFHAPDVPFFWGRGDGWMAAGMAELLRTLPAGHPDRARILDGYRKMMAALLQHQDANGMWHQLIDDPAAWPETSCTGMFTFAFITGVKEGWLDGKTYGPAARKAWLALIGYLDASADLREVCEGTGKKNDHQYYLDRPRHTGDLHGQAPVLWCAGALLR